ncbi:hypothetical protein C4J81_18660 (plasmid) [Deltaproteobacteria bacterium Smac51]|nr:hypothetical protein C4J81_18660 [Deltaproteobacteria bacterium Smac51]
MPEPKLTIGIPVYNGQKNLARCLDSILAQTFTNFRVMILDNASTDRTPAILKEYAEKDSRVNYSTNRSNLGAQTSYYRLLFGTLTEYFALVHVDLQWAPAFAEKCLTALERDSEAVLAYPQCQFVDENGHKLDLYRDSFDFAAEDAGLRFLNLVTGLGWCTAWHGVVKTDTMHDQSLNALSMNTGNAAPDNFLLAFLAARGKLVQVEEPLLIREKAVYQAQPETMPDRYARMFTVQMLFPFITFIQDHMTAARVTNAGYAYADSIAKAGYKRGADGTFAHQRHNESFWAERLPKADQVMNKMIGSLLATYRSYIEFELDRMAELVASGDIHRIWQDDKAGIKGLESRKTGVNRSLDFAVLTQINSGLDFAYSLIPAHPGLHFTRALVKMWLGRPDEALLAVNRELKRDPIHLKSLELQKHLEKVLAGEPAAGNHP